LSSAGEGALVPLDLFKECGTCPETVVVPAGDFVMGSPAAGAPSGIKRAAALLTMGFSGPCRVHVA
jgi:hypothetical protein